MHYHLDLSLHHLEFLLAMGRSRIQKVRICPLSNRDVHPVVGKFHIRVFHCRTITCGCIPSEFGIK